MASKKKAPQAPPRLNFPIFLIALFGVLVVVHLWIQVERGFTHGCLGFSAPTGEIAECAGVVGSELGAIGGVSNVWLGLLFYLTLVGLRLGIAALRPPTSTKLQKASFGVAGVGMAYAVYLVFAQVFVLDQYCVLCLISAATTTAIFALHIVEWRRGQAAEPPPAGGKQRAVVRSVSLRPYGIGLAALVLLAAADVALLSDRDESAPLATTENGDAPVRPTGTQLAQACQYDESLPDFRLFDMLTSGRAAYDGAEGASGRVLKVFDPNCPHCATLHTAMKGVVPEHRNDTRFYYQPIALWDFSIPQVQAMYIAREAGNEPFLRMMDLQLDHQRRGGIPVDTLVAYAGRVGLDEAAFRQEMESGRFVNVIRSEQQMIGGAGVNSVPKLFVEGRAIQNTQLTWTPECLNYFAENASSRR